MPRVLHRPCWVANEIDLGFLDLGVHVNARVGFAPLALLQVGDVVEAPILPVERDASRKRFSWLTG